MFQDGVTDHVATPGPFIDARGGGFPGRLGSAPTTLQASGPGTICHQRRLTLLGGQESPTSVLSPHLVSAAVSSAPVLCLSLPPDVSQPSTSGVAVSETRGAHTHFLNDQNGKGRGLSPGSSSSNTFACVNDMQAFKRPVPVSKRGEFTEPMVVCRPVEQSLPSHRVSLNEFGPSGFSSNPLAGTRGLPGLLSGVVSETATHERSNGSNDNSFVNRESIRPGQCDNIVGGQRGGGVAPLGINRLEAASAPALTRASSGHSSYSIKDGIREGNQACLNRVHPAIEVAMPDEGNKADSYKLAVLADEDGNPIQIVSLVPGKSSLYLAATSNEAGSSDASCGLDASTRTIAVVEDGKQSLLTTSYDQGSSQKRISFVQKTQFSESTKGEDAHFVGSSFPGLLASNLTDSHQNVNIIPSNAVVIPARNSVGEVPYGGIQLSGSPVNYVVQVSEEDPDSKRSQDDSDEEEEDMVTEDDILNNNDMRSTSTNSPFYPNMLYTANNSNNMNNNTNNNGNVSGNLPTAAAVGGLGGHLLLGNASDASERRDLIPVHTALDLATGQLCVISIPKQQPLTSRDLRQAQLQPQPQPQPQQQEQQQQHQQQEKQPQHQQQQYQLTLQNISAKVSPTPCSISSNNNSSSNTNSNNPSRNNSTSRLFSLHNRDAANQNYTRDTAEDAVSQWLPPTVSSAGQHTTTIELGTRNSSQALYGTSYVAIPANNVNVLYRDSEAKCLPGPDRPSPVRLRLDTESERESMIDPQIYVSASAQSVTNPNIHGDLPRSPSQTVSLATNSGARMSSGSEPYSANLYSTDVRVAQRELVQRVGTNVAVPLSFEPQVRSEHAGKIQAEGVKGRTWRFHNVSSGMKSLERRRESVMEVDGIPSATQASELVLAQQVLPGNIYRRAFSASLSPLSHSSSSPRASLSSSSTPSSSSSPAAAASFLPPSNLSAPAMSRSTSAPTGDHREGRDDSPCTISSSPCVGQRRNESVPTENTHQHPKKCLEHIRSSPVPVRDISQVASFTVSSVVSMSSSKPSSSSSSSPLSSSSSSHSTSTQLPQMTVTSSLLSSAAISYPQRSSPLPSSSLSSSSSSSSFPSTPSSLSSSSLSSTLLSSSKTTSFTQPTHLKRTGIPPHTTLSSRPFHIAVTTTDITHPSTEGVETLPASARPSPSLSYASVHADTPPKASPDSEVSPSTSETQSASSSYGENRLIPNSPSETASLNAVITLPTTTATLAAAAAAEATTTTTTMSSGTPAESASTSANDQAELDSGRRLRVRGQRRFLPEKARHKRQALQDMTRPLKLWLYRHRQNPYPSKSEKMELVKTSQMSLTQVSNWFANARRRLKNTVQGDGISWSRRIQAYNECAEGNAELFSIPSSEEEDDDDCLRPDAEPGRHGIRDDETIRRRSSGDAEDAVSPRLVLDLPPDELSPLRGAAITPEATAVKRKRQDGDHAGDDVDFMEGAGSDPTVGDFKRRGQLPDRRVRDREREREVTTPSPAPTLTSSFSDAGCSVTSPGSAPSSTPGPPLFSVPGRQMTPPVGTSSGGGVAGSGGGACHKYKHSMMQRYLHDASQQAAISNDLDLAGARFRHRHLSSSTGSHDFEYLSTSSVSSPSHEPQDPQPDAFDDFSEEFESIAIRRRLSENTSTANDEMYWKEIGAALALTTLARSNVPK